jgi:hypothetical protein
MFNTKSGGTDRARLCGQIDSDDYPYLVRSYLSNHVGSVDYHLETGPDLSYIYMAD